MRPNTPHFVITTEHAICHGGHFYAMSTIRDTCFGIYHTFIGGGTLTNTEYSLHANQMLTRMLFFIHDNFVCQGYEVHDDPTGGNAPQYPSSNYSNIVFHFQDIEKMHLPDPSTFYGLMDILILSILMELGNVVSFWSYQETESSESLHERGRMIHARACARELVEWLFSKFELVDHSNPSTTVDGKVDVYWTYLVHHGQLLVAYKQQAFENCMEWSGPGQCLPGDVKSAVERSFAHNPTLQQMYVSQKLKSTTFAWPGLAYAVRKRSSPTPLKGVYIFLHFWLLMHTSAAGPHHGYTSDDMNYIDLLKLPHPNPEGMSICLGILSSGLQ
jgi:hypothetical protein